MSDTIRKVIRRKIKHNPHSQFDNGFMQSYEVVEVDDTQAKYQKERQRKMKPYSKNGEPKFDAGTYMVESPGRERKLKIKNANRTLKKGERHRIKNELRREVEALQNEQE